MNVAENRSFRKWHKHLGQQQIGHRLEPIPGSRMPSNLHTECSQLLHQAPNFRTCSPNLGSNLCSAHHDRRVIHQQLNNPPNAEIGRYMWRGPALSGVECAPTREPGVEGAFLMRGIMENSKRKNKAEPALN